MGFPVVLTSQTDLWLREACEDCRDVFWDVLLKLCEASWSSLSQVADLVDPSVMHVRLQDPHGSSLRISWRQLPESEDTIQVIYVGMPEGF